MENNFEIDTALSAEEAFNKMEQQTYDVVVSDYEMPQKNGLVFLKELREQNNQISFILFTGKGREDVAVKALNLGADSYLNKNGSPETVYCELVHAINKTVERKKSAQLLAESESKYRVLVEKSLQGILVTKAAPLRLVFANDAIGKILGYSPNELLSLSPESIMGLVYHEDRAAFFKRMENRLMSKPADECYEFRAVRKDSSVTWLSAFANRIDFDGQPAVQGMFLDINENKISEAILRESEQRYRELANCLPDIVFETDVRGQLEFANERAAEISGYSLVEIEKGLNIIQFVIPEDRARATKNIQRLLSGGSYVPAEYTFLRKDGTTFPALITATPRICKDTVTGLRGIVLDISERKINEEALFESEERFRKAFLTSPDAFYIGTLDDGKILEINEPFEEVFGYNRLEAIGKTSLELSLWANPIDIQEIVSNLRSDGKVQNREVLGIRKSGQIFPLQISISVVEANHQQLTLGVIRDVSSCKKSEEVVRKSEARYRELANFLPDIVFEADLSGKITFFSQRAFELTGFTPEELEKGMNMLQFVVPEEQEIAKENIKKALSGRGREGHEYTLYRKNGSKYSAIVRTAPIIFEDKVIGLRGLVIDITERKEN